MIAEKTVDIIITLIALAKNFSIASIKNKLGDNTTSFIHHHQQLLDEHCSTKSGEKYDTLNISNTRQALM